MTKSTDRWVLSAPEFDCDGRPLIPGDISRSMTPQGFLAKVERLNSLRRWSPNPQFSKEISDLQEVIDNASVKPAPQCAEFAVLGTEVTLSDSGAAPEAFELVGPSEVNHDASHLDVTSELGRALYGRKVGEKVTIRSRGWGTYTIVIIAIRIPSGPPS